MEVRNLNVTYGQKKVLRNISFSTDKINSLGILGESGSGKTTLSLSVARLIHSGNIDGEVIYDGIDILKLPRKELMWYRKKVQIIFQDPFSSFNPKMKIGDAIREGLDIHMIGNTKRERKDIVIDLLKRVGMNEVDYDKYPHQFSGGQRQRLAIARALAVNPELIIADEAVSSLDVSIQAQILNLFADLQEKTKVKYIFVSHDLNVVKYFCDYVFIIYNGELMEFGPKTLLDSPFHPYTELLLSSTPGSTYEYPEVLEKNIGSTCPFVDRCYKRNNRCVDYSGVYFKLGDRLTTCVLANT